MPDKQLTEAAWKMFAKSAGAGFKDAALLKALAALDKAEKTGPGDELDALEEIEKQAGALGKAHKGDKKLEAYLSDLDKALVKQRKASEKVRDEAARKAAGDAEEEDSPAALTSQMIPLLRQVRKGDVVMQALIAVAGKDTAVLLSKRSISPTRGKLLKEYLGASGGLKFIRGECLFEENAVTFVVQSAAAGLAKKLKTALQLQTDMRLKVRVRGEDPDDLDEDGEDAGGLEGQEEDAGHAAPGAPQQQAPQEKVPDDPDQAVYEARIAKVEPVVMLALKQSAGDVSKLRAVLAFVQEKGNAKLFAAALQGLDMLEKLVLASGVKAPADAGGNEKRDDPAGTRRDEGREDKGLDPGAAFTARLTALMPAIKDAIGAAGAQAQDVKLKTSEAGVLARKREFDTAHALLDEVEQLLAGKTAQGRPGSSSGDADAGGGKGADWQRRVAEARTRLDAAVAARPADAVKLRAVLDYAQKQADAGDLGKALGALDQLDTLLAARPSGSRNAYIKTLHDFRAAAKKVTAQIDALKAAIPQAMAAQSELADELALVLHEQNEALLDVIDEALNDPGVTPTLAATLDRMAADVVGNPLIRFVDTNPFGVAMSVESTLYAALIAIRKALPQSA